MTTNTTAAAIAAQIRSARKSRGWSQEELAEQAGVAAGTVGRVEQGLKVRPGNLYSIRTTLGLPDGDDGEDEERELTPRERKIETTMVLVRKWLLAVPEDELEDATNELTRWVVTRL